MYIVTSSFIIVDSIADFFCIEFMTIYTQKHLCFDFSLLRFVCKSIRLNLNYRTHDFNVMVKKFKFAFNCRGN